MNPYPRHADDTAELDATDVLIQPGGESRPAPGAESRPVAELPADAEPPAGIELPVDVDLDRDPFADDLSEQLDAVAPRRWAGRTTMALAALVLLVGGFLGGAQVQRHWGTTPAAAAPRNPFGNGGALAGGNGDGRLRGGAGGTAGASAAPDAAGSGGAPGFNRGGNATTGTVKLVDGNTVYITTANGQTVIVKTTGSTTVNTTQPGSLKDLAPGSSVSIQGQTGSDGSVSATTITRTK